MIKFAKKTCLSILVSVLALLIVTSVGGAQQYNEAPELRELVAQGELPPVEERLPIPEDIYVVEPVERIGRYGGVARTATTAPLGAGSDTLLGGFPNPMTASADGTKVVPHVARKLEHNEDYSVWTMYFRRGMKWSDGHPFGADDIMFWYEHVLQNEDLTPSIPSKWINDQTGELIKIVKIDDHTIQLDFGGPRPFFPNSMIEAGIWDFQFLPKHYMKQFHPDFADPDELAAKVEEAGFQEWYELFGYQNDSIWGTPIREGRPAITPFIVDQISAERRSFKRNPYFWKVDSAGNQLPYLDGITAEIVADQEVVQGMIMSGQLDFEARNTEIANYPMYRRFEEDGNYRTILWDTTFGSQIFYQLNLTVEDPVLRQIFQDVRFRRALSLAINREEINEMLYFGQGEPRQYTVLDDSPFFEPEFAKAYTEYDPAEANRLLDEMGLDKRDSQGFRLRPDGERLFFEIEYVEASVPRAANTELVTQYWNEVGIDVRAREISGELAGQRSVGNLTQASNWVGDRSTHIMFTDAAWKYLVSTDENWEGPQWPLWSQWWSSNGQQGEEPIPEIQQLYDWYQELLREPDEERRTELAKNILRSHAENLWIIGTVGKVPHPIIVSKDLRNFPEEGLWGWDTGVYNMNRSPSQIFFDR